MGLTTSRTIIPVKDAHDKLGPALLARLEKVRGGGRYTPSCWSTTVLYCTWGVLYAVLVYCLYCTVRYVLTCPSGTYWYLISLKR